MSIMPEGLIIRFRANPLTRRLLDRLRDEKAINVSAWLRKVVQQALEQEFPDEATQTPETEPQKTTAETETAPETEPQKTTIEGWRPRRLPGDNWGAVIEGPRVAELPDNDNLPGTPIVVTDKRDESWSTTITEVVDRTDTIIVVKNSGRPRT